MGEYDVIVVGAGPGGATAARQLARAGFKTLLLEKEKLPRYKPCGGGITAKVAQALDVDFSTTVQDTIHALSVVYGAKERVTVNYRHPIGWCVMRDKFDALLAEHAARAGAELRDDSPATRVAIEADGVRVQTARDELRAAAVVGADGANGIVARAAGLHKKRRLGAAVEAELDVPASSIEAWRGAWHLDFGAMAWGYGWIFPKAEHLSVGVGALLRAGVQLNLRESLKRYIASEPTLRAYRNISVRGHLVPLGGLAQPLHAPRAVLVGDAAGLIDPLTGEGIYAAIKSGVVAAEEIGRACAAGDFALAHYSRRIHAAFTRDYGYAWALSNITYRAPRLAVGVLARATGIQRALSYIAQDASGYQRALDRLLRAPGKLWP